MESMVRTPDHSADGGTNVTCARWSCAQGKHARGAYSARETGVDPDGPRDPAPSHGPQSRRTTLTRCVWHYFGGISNLWALIFVCERRGVRFPTLNTKTVRDRQM